MLKAVRLLASLLCIAAAVPATGRLDPAGGPLRREEFKLATF
jgi:hypothetical protein